MITIYKYPLSGFSMALAKQEIKLEVPTNAKFLSVIEQDDLPCVYAQVDNIKYKEERRFLIVGTGHPIDNPFTKYIGTCVIDWYVAHVFEVIK